MSPPEPAPAATPTTTGQRSCGACGAPVGVGDDFCESCGNPLSASASASAVDLHAAPTPVPDPAVVATGPPDTPASGRCRCGGRFDDDGYCDTCGSPRQRPRDRWTEQPAPWVAGTCDRGVRHPRNEDAMALVADVPAGSFAALVVCDGVTTATASDLASMAAARAARDSLAGARLGGATNRSTSPSARIVHWTDALVVATAAANAEVVNLAATVDADLEPPSCTFVTGLVDGSVMVVAWVGDSRAYWLPDAGAPVQLTVDHSWASAQIELGASRADAEAAPESHGITRWLGVDAPDPTPDCTSTTVEGPGWLVVCSDGLWNYCSPADDLRELVTDLVVEHGADPAALASALVDFANGRGGIDNITAAVARVGATPTPTADGSAAESPVTNTPSADPRPAG
jgi:serine/threonine protein phosphatase PrpC